MSYYLLGAAGETKGPYALDQLRHMWREGRVTNKTLYCEEGYAEWLPLSALPELEESAPAAPAAMLVSAYARLLKPKPIEEAVSEGVVKGIVFILAVLILLWVIAHSL